MPGPLPTGGRACQPFPAGGQLRFSPTRRSRIIAAAREPAMIVVACRAPVPTGQPHSKSSGASPGQCRTQAAAIALAQIAASGEGDAVRQDAPSVRKRRSAAGAASARASSVLRRHRQQGIAMIGLCRRESFRQ
jgi:hypothetical protein